MSELKDSAIKLFGKTIPLPPQNQGAFTDDSSTRAAATSEGGPDHNLPSPTSSLSADQSNVGLPPAKALGQDNKGSGEKELTEDKQEESTSHQAAEDSKDPTTSSGISDNPKIPSVERETSSLKTSKNGGEQSETSSSQEKTLKKPDKILPCPRCNSMDTKFCYYNNYNVNQPRHFCKNCQRYWTAGGTMRNVPVGAGRRKNKSSSASHYRHIMVSEAIRAAHASANMNGGVPNPSLGNNNHGHVLTFGSDSPLCESVAVVLNMSEKPRNSTRNGFHIAEQRILVSVDNGNENSSGSSLTASNSSEKIGNGSLNEAAVKGSYHGFPPPQVPCFAAPPAWSYPWGSAQWNSAMPPPPPTFCPPGFPIPIYPAPTYWGCSVPAAPWNAQPAGLAISTSSVNESSGPTSPTLGKHSREGKILSPTSLVREDLSRSESKNKNSEANVVVPKTLRIDDPSEAAKSSIWATLGINKNEKTSSTNAAGLFKGFQSKSDDKNFRAETAAVLQANPAALSRSLYFQERT